MPRPHDDLDDMHAPLMADAHARRRSLEADDEAADAAAWERATDEAPVTRRPQTMTNRRRLDTGALAALAVAALFALIFAVSITWRPAAETSEHPSYAAPTAPAAAPPALPAPESAPPRSAPQEPAQAFATPAPLPTGWIVGSEAGPAPAQLAPAAPQAPAVYVVPAPTASALQPLPTEPAGWHPPFVSGYSPTENYVEVREP
jgi:hypothetical protein